MSKERIESFSGPYRFLSNFYEFRWPIVCEHRFRYYTVENAYQAAKSMYHNDRKDIKDLSAAKAKIAGNNLRNIRPDWEQVKRAIMLELSLQKYIHNEDCREWLLDTGNAELIEGNHWGDTYWGVCNGRGENHLGKLLMQVREILR